MSKQEEIKALKKEIKQAERDHMKYSIYWYNLQDALSKLEENA